MSNPTSIAAANALSGEKSFATISYPITGDDQLDAISGCLLVLRQIGVNDPQGIIQPRQYLPRISVLKYLLERLTSLQAEEDRQREVLSQNRLSQGIGQGIPGAIRSPLPDPYFGGPYSSSGGYGPPGQMAPANAGLQGTLKDPTNCAWGLDPAKQSITFKELQDEMIRAIKSP